MLGLGLGSHKASALRSLAAKLLAKLRGRSTYYENDQGSKDTISDINNASVLDKATILLTPTATSDARVHSVKTYTGDELVANGNFEGLGDEKVTNGDFSADSNWNQVGSNGWSIDIGTSTLNFTNASSYVFQGISTVSGKSYKVTLDIELNSGTIIAKSFAAQNVLTVTSTGRQTLIGYFKEGDSNANFGIQASGSASGKVYSVSVKEVSDWTLGTGWSIEDGIATCDGTQTSTSILDTSNGLSVQHKTVKVTFDLTRTAGSVTVTLQGTGSNDLSNLNSTNTYSFYAVSVDASSKLQFKADSSFVGTVDNVSVVDVSSDFDFDRASSATRINSSGLVQDMQSITDPELVLNGDYEELGDNGINYPSGVSTTAGPFELDSSTGLYTYNKSVGGTGTMNFTSAIAAEVGQTYKIVIDITISSGNAFVALKSGNAQTSLFDFTDLVNGVNTLFSTVTGVNGSVSRIIVSSGATDNSFTLNSISVQKVDPNERWSVGTAWSIANGVATASSAGFLIQSNATTGTSGETYRLTYTVSGSNDGSLQLAGGSNPFGTQTIPSTDGTHTLNLATSSTVKNLQFYANAFRGSIDNVSLKNTTFSTDVDLARINYDGNGANGHILLEPTSTNLVTYSQEFGSGKYFHTTQATLASDNNLAPDGTNTATQLLSTGTGKLLTSSVTLPANTTYTLSFFAKNVDATEVQSKALALGGSGGTNLTSVSYFSQINTTTFTRITHTFTTNSTEEDYLLYISNALNSGGNIQLWGAQLEQLSYATSYIPTLTGSTVTRAAETLTGSGNSTLINSTEGVLYAEIAALTDNPSQQIGIYGDSVSKQLRLEIANNGNSIIRAQLFNGAFQANMSSTQTVTNFNKIAFKWKADDFALWINGREVATDSSGTTFSANDLDRVHFAGQNGSTSAAQAKVKALAVFNEALSDTQLTNLTS